MRPLIAVMVVSLLFVPVGCAESRVPRAPAATPSPIQVQAQPTPRRDATQEERQLYAEREKQAVGLEKFRGGDAGVVTVLVVVLLVVVILMLLKVI
jgi:hypothetical protein